MIHAIYLVFNFAVATYALRLPLQLKKSVVIMCSQKTLPMAMTIVSFLPPEVPPPNAPYRPLTPPTAPYCPLLPPTASHRIPPRLPHPIAPSAPYHTLPRPTAPHRTFRFPAPAAPAAAFCACAAFCHPAASAPECAAIPPPPPPPLPRRHGIITRASVTRMALRLVRIGGQARSCLFHGRYSAVTRLLHRWASQASSRSLASSRISSRSSPTPSSAPSGRSTAIPTRRATVCNGVIVLY